MPSKQAVKRPPPADLDDPLGTMLLGPDDPDDIQDAVEDPSEGSPRQPIFEPATDEPDDQDDQDDQEASPAQGPPKASRRGFLGQVAAMAGGAVLASSAPVAEAAPPPVPPAASPIGGMTPEMAQMASFFTQLMDQRDGQLLDELDRRLGAIRAELPVPNGVAEAPAELVARPGEYPPSMVFAQPQPTPTANSDMLTRPMGFGSVTQTAAQPQLQQRRMVAFIPREDPYNPRQTTFRGWVNGRELRAKRGQIMIVELGTGVDWAKNGHGNCVDIAAMQGVGTVEPMPIPQAPDYSRPATWDGLPMTNRSSIPV